MRKQRTAKELGFSHHDIKRLGKGMQEVKDKCTYLRLQAVLKVAEGMSAGEVVQLTGSCLKSIYNQVDCYLSTHQVSSLFDAPRPGRPLTAISITDSKIKKALLHSPFKLGYGVTVWTVRLLTSYLSSKYKCAISVHTLRRRMKKMGLRFKRPTYVYAQKDPHWKQKKGLLFES